ncbi:MAG: general secretion pathway protein GspK [Candidatus Omnitrophica bacterium]|nr:general secretion pathway protein GspK [Candidatus Omnitrophota bacterium]
MRKQGSILILFLWVLVFLTLFAVSLTMRTRIATKIESFYGRRMSADYDFLSAVNLARFFITEDEDAGIDSPQDDWYGTPEKFEDSKFAEEFSLEIHDEESKINLNLASERLLISFFEVLKDHDMELESDIKELAANIIRWRGGVSPAGSSKDREKFKQAPFESVDELFLVPEVEASDIEILKPYFTVYGNSNAKEMRVNINTAHPFILEALITSIPGASVTKRELWQRLEKFLNPSQSEDEEAAEDEREIFHGEFLNIDAFMRKLALSDTPIMHYTAGQFLRFVTADSRYFMVSVRTKRQRVGISKVEAVFGAPREDRSMKMALARAGFRLVTTPLEVHSWKEVR